MASTAAEATAGDPQKSWPRAAIWIHPVSALAWTTTGDGSFHLPIGMNLSLDNRHSWVFEASYLRQRFNDFSELIFLESDVALVSTGLSFQLTGGSPMLGLFLQPKLLFALLR